MAKMTSHSLWCQRWLALGNPKLKMELSSWKNPPFNFYGTCLANTFETTSWYETTFGGGIGLHNLFLRVQKKIRQLQHNQAALQCSCCWNRSRMRRCKNVSAPGVELVTHGTGQVPRMIHPRWELLTKSRLYTNCQWDKI